MEDFTIAVVTTRYGIKNVAQKPTDPSYGSFSDTQLVSQVVLEIAGHVSVRVLDVFYSLLYVQLGGDRQVRVSRLSLPAQALEYLHPHTLYELLVRGFKSVPFFELARAEFFRVAEDVWRGDDGVRKYRAAMSRFSRTQERQYFARHGLSILWPPLPNLSPKAKAALTKVAEYLTPEEFNVLSSLTNVFSPRFFLPISDSVKACTSLLDAHREIERWSERQDSITPSTLLSSKAVLWMLRSHGKPLIAYLAGRDNCPMTEKDIETFLEKEFGDGRRV